MNIWLPDIAVGSGSDVFTSILARGLREAGHQVTTTRYRGPWQFAPHGLLRERAPAGTQIVVTNNAYAFAFRRPGTKLVSVEHHCSLDPSYAPFRSRAPRGVRAQNQAVHESA